METGSRLTSTQVQQLMQQFPMRAVEGGTIMTGPLRGSFMSLHKKTAFQKGTPKFQAGGLFQHSNIDPLYQMCAAAVRQHYPNVTDPNVMLDRWNKDHPIRDQGLKVSSADGGRAIGKTTGGYVTGLPFINPKSGNTVHCFVAVNGRWERVYDEAEIEKQFYGGAWYQYKVNAFKNTAGNPGISLGLQGAWKIADDNSFGGGGGGAAADEGGDAGAAVTIEDPNAALTAAGGGWGGQPAQQSWD